MLCVANRTVLVCENEANSCHILVTSLILSIYLKQCEPSSTYTSSPQMMTSLTFVIKCCCLHCLADAFCVFTNEADSAKASAARDVTRCSLVLRVMCHLPRKCFVTMTQAATSSIVMDIWTKWCQALNVLVRESCSTFGQAFCHRDAGTYVGGRQCTCRASFHNLVCAHCWAVANVKRWGKDHPTCEKTKSWDLSTK